MTSPKTWMITGAGRGLGRALALAALDQGHAVVATVRGDHDLPVHERLDVQTLDVRDPRAAHDAVGRAAARMGAVDVLVNNAGHGLVGAVEEVSEDDVRAVVETNLLGPLWLTRAVIPVMRAQGSGHVVQISTVGAVGTMPMLGVYCSTKWGLEAFSEAMAGEVRSMGIRVTIVEPGALDTDWAGSSMRFSSPHPAYDHVRAEVFGTEEVPWPPSDAHGGTTPEQAAAAILEHVAAPDDGRLRVLVGEDAPGQVRAALDLRTEDYSKDPIYRGGEIAP